MAAAKGEEPMTTAELRDACQSLRDEVRRLFPPDPAPPKLTVIQGGKVTPHEVDGGAA